MATKTKPTPGCIHGVPIGEPCRHCADHANVVSRLVRFGESLKLIAKLDEPLSAKIARDALKEVA